jgi:hypothetical protein
LSGRSTTRVRNASTTGSQIPSSMRSNSFGSFWLNQRTGPRCARRRSRNQHGFA